MKYMYNSESLWRAYTEHNIKIFYSISKSYKKNYIEGSGAFDFYYVSRVFCGWDYGITNKKAAKLKSMSIYHELQVILPRDSSL